MYIIHVLVFALLNCTETYIDICELKLLCISIYYWCKNIYSKNVNTLINRATPYIKNICTETYIQCYNDTFT